MLKSLVCLLGAGLLTGCAMSPTASPIPTQGLALRGMAHGGQQPIVGAHVYLYAANVTGYGGSGIAPSDNVTTGNKSLSLLNSSVLTNEPDNSGLDTNGKYYVTTAQDGSFAISNDYTCTSGQQVYVYVTGGNPGSGTNSAESLMAVLGNCPVAGTFPSTTYIWVNEVTTAAAAYAMSGFASDATHVSTSGSDLAKVGITAAFAGAQNLATLATGTALAKPALTAGTAPQTLIDSVANILAACVNSTDTSHAHCDTLFENATTDGVATTSTGNSTNPVDTATAAINMVHHPTSNISALYVLQSGIASPFVPNLGSSMPASFTATLTFTGFSSTQGLAIDSSDNVWVADASANTVVKLSNLGVKQASYAPTGSGLSGPRLITITTGGKVWIGNVNANNVTGLNSDGTLLASIAVSSTPESFTADGAGNAWMTQYTGGTLQEFTPAGSLSTTYTFPYATDGVSRVIGAAVDKTGDFWFSNSLGSLCKATSAGVFAACYSPTGSNFNLPAFVAINGSSNPWTVNQGNGSVTSLTSTGALGINTTGLPTTLHALAMDGASNVWVGTTPTTYQFNSLGTVTQSYSFNSYAIAVDGAGNVWAANDNGTVTELMGVSIPVVTPIAANLASPYGASEVNRP
jgi:hypothetical protein